MKASVVIGTLACVCSLASAFPAVASGVDSAKAKIGITLPTQNIERFYREGQFLQQAFEDEGYDVSLYYAGDNDLEIQQRQITRMVDEGCEVIIVGAVDSYKLGEQLQKAKEAGVKVVAYGSMLMNTDAVDYMVAFDAKRTGEMQGDYLRSALNLDDASSSNPRTIEVFSGVAADSSSQAVFLGAMSVLNPYIESGALLVRSGDIDFASTNVGVADAESIKRMDDLVAAQGYAPDGVRLDAVLSPSDIASAAIIASLERVGYTSENMPKITGQDCSSLGVHNIEKGVQGMSVFKDGRVLANSTVKMTASILKGDQVRVTNPGIDNGVKQVPSYECEPVNVADGQYAQVMVDNGYLTQNDIDNPF